MITSLLDDIFKLKEEVQKLKTQQEESLAQFMGRRFHAGTAEPIVDTAIALEILRYTGAMLDGMDLGCHLLNHVER